MKKLVFKNSVSEGIEFNINENDELEIISDQTIEDTSRFSLTKEQSEELAFFLKNHLID